MNLFGSQTSSPPEAELNRGVPILATATLPIVGEQGAEQPLLGLTPLGLIILV